MEPDTKRRPTIRDVASAAGVSRGTVSRFLNGEKWVSPQARSAVERAISSTGYRVNRHARTLATGRTGSLAFLLTEPQTELFSDPTFAILLRGCADALAEHDQTLITLVAGRADERERVLRYVADRHVDGVLLVSSHENEPLLGAILAEGLPLVTCGLPLGYADQVGSVSTDEAGGARAMVAHLAGLGRRRIAMIAGPPDTPGGRYRLEGYRAELAARGLPAEEDLIAHGDWSRDSGREAMSVLLERAGGVDAVFAANDRMAQGALEVLRAAERSVPGDVAVAGFDDGGLAAALDLTTMHQPFDRISREMVTLALELIAGGEPKSVTIPARLVVRGTA